MCQDGGAEFISASSGKIGSWLALVPFFAGQRRDIFPYLSFRMAVIALTFWKGISMMGDRKISSLSMTKWRDEHVFTQ